MKTLNTNQTSAPPGKRRRSARLQKKLHICEFQEFGFSFDADIDESFTEQQIEDATFALLAGSKRGRK